MKTFFAKCAHEWVPWSGKQRCRKCGTTKG